MYDDSDNSLLGTLGNGVNNQLLDTPQFTPGPLRINTNPRNGQPEFNTALFAPESLGQLGNARRRFFYGPGISNFDVPRSELSESSYKVTGKPVLKRVVPEISQPCVRRFDRLKRRSKGTVYL